MSKTILSLVVVASVLIALPVQGVTCYRCFCDHAVNGNFSNSSTWTFSNCGSGTWCGTVQQTDPCGLYTWMAHISYPGTTIKMQQFTFPVDAGPNFFVDFDILASSVPGTFYDEVRVYVKDVSTGVTELVGAAHGSQLTNGCKRFSLQTSTNYAGKTVELKFVTGSLTNKIWYLDNVSFWAGYSC